MAVVMSALDRDYEAGLAASNSILKSPKKCEVQVNFIHFIKKSVGGVLFQPLILVVQNEQNFHTLKFKHYIHLRIICNCVKVEA